MESRRKSGIQQRKKTRLKNQHAGEGISQNSCVAVYGKNYQAVLVSTSANVLPRGEMLSKETI